MAYQDLFARYYDVFYAAKDYAQETAWLHAQFSQTLNPGASSIFECACGTGKHAALLSIEDWRISGYDLSHDMIAEANARNAGNARLTFFQGDMTGCGPRDQSFDGAMVLFDSLGHLVEWNLIVKALQNFRANLKSGGILIGEVWHAPAFLSHHDPVRIKQWTLEDGTHILRRSETTIDSKNSLGIVDFHLEVTRNGRVETASERNRCRFFTASEIRNLLSETGFDLKSMHPGFVDERPLKEDDFHVVLVARAV
jgi:SAM-dependent methyltransferase